LAGGVGETMLMTKESLGYKQMREEVMLTAPAS
jgi:hypothetical protein